MDTTLLIILLFAVLIPILTLLGIVFFAIKKYTRVATQTQMTISDRDILWLIHKQPDGLLSAEQLANMSGLSKSDAKIRLYQLHAFGVLKVYHNAWVKGYYSLTSPIEERTGLELSKAPFLTVEDILKLFQYFDFRITPQELIMVTGLPLNIIKREIKYFQSQKIVQTLTLADNYGIMVNKTFVLQEPYRSNPNRFLERQLDLNQQMETILRKEDLV